MSDSGYLVADGPGGLWPHIFHGNQEDLVRFVFSFEEEQIVAMEVRMVDRGASTFRSATAEEIADVNDSLLNANSEALESWVDWGLERTDTPPHWANLPEGLSMQ